MKIKLEYVDGEVKATNTENYQVPLNEAGLSPLFKDYYKEIKDVYEKHMQKIEKKSRGKPLGKLEIELELKEK